jgi:hypothetical protein
MGPEVCLSSRLRHPKKLRWYGTKEPGFYPMQGNGCLPKIGRAGKWADPFITGLNCCQLCLNSRPVSSIITSSLEPSLVNRIKRQTLTFAFLTIALCYLTLKFWNNGGGN